MKRIEIFLALGVLLLCSFDVQAKNDCEIKNFKNTIAFVTSSQSFLSFMNTTNKDNYESRKRTLLSGISLLPIPIQAFGDYSDFQNKRIKVFSDLHYTRTEEQDASYVSAILSPDDREAYLDCLREGNGLSVVATKETGDDVTFRFYWRSASTDKKFANLKMSAIGGKMIFGSYSDPHGLLTPSAEGYFIYKLKRNEPFHLIMTTVPPGYQSEVDYLIPQYAECRTSENGLERDKDGNEMIVREHRTWEDMNARYVDKEKAKARIEEQIYESHPGVKIRFVGDISEVDGNDNGHHKIDRWYTADVEYGAVYKLAPNVACGLQKRSRSSADGRK